MIYKIDKVTYIVAIFFIVAVLDIAFNKSGINFRFIFYFLFSLIIFKDIINANLQWFFSKTNFKIFKKVLFLYFLCHPILISIFGLFGFWGLLVSISPVSVLLSGANMTFQGLIGIFFLVHINAKNYESINKFICFIAWCFLVEFLIMKFFLIESAFGASAEFVSFIDSEWHVSVFALFAFYWSMKSFSISKRFKYLLYGICFLFLGYVAQLRIFQLGVVIYLFMMFAMYLKINMVTLVVGVFFSIFLFVVYNLGKLESADPENLYDRLYLFAKQIDLISKNFIVGVGGNVSEKYYGSTSSHLLTTTAETIGLTNLETFNKVQSANRYMDKIGFYSKRSSHNTALDIIGDYGVLGIITVSIWIIWPLKILNRIRKSQKKDILGLQLQHAAIAVLSFFAFNFFESSGQYLWLVFLGYSYMLYLDRVWKQRIL